MAFLSLQQLPSWLVTVATGDTSILLLKTLVVYAVTSSILQEFCLRYVVSKHPRTNATTETFLVGDAAVGAKYAPPDPNYFPFRLLHNVLYITVLLPTVITFAITVMLPAYMLHSFCTVYLSLDTSRMVAIVCALVTLEAYWLYTLPSLEDPRDRQATTTPEGRKKRVAIIGAGSSGLAVAKEMIAEGHEPVMFEKTSATGGLWQRNVDAEQRKALVMENTFTSSTALNTAFSDFPIQAEFGGPETYCISQKGYMKYLDSYADHFGLKEYVQFNTSVIKVYRNKDDTQWVVVTTNTDNSNSDDGSNKSPAEEITYEFDLLAICSGQTAIPKIPTIPGQENFKGMIRHSSELRTTEQITKLYKNKRVLSVGGGESASDNAGIVARAASQCDLSIRNSVIILFRNLFGTHPDHIEHRSQHMCPDFVRWATYKAQLPTMPLLWSFAKVWRGRTLHPPSWSLFVKMLFTPKFFWDTVVTGKRSPCASLQQTKTENYLYIINNETTKVKPGIDRIDCDGQVVFTNGSVGEYDEILLNTGFQGDKFLFLPTGFDDGVSHTRQDRYLGMIHPQLPDMAFIGFSRGNVGSLILGFEMQARWFALLASEKRDWPTMCEMREAIARDYLEKDCYEYSRGSWFYANYLARYHVKCEPVFLQFFLQAPVACIKAYCSAPAGYQYRMRGPHPNPTAVIEGYRLSRGAFWHTPPIWFLLHPLWFLIGMACDYFWSNLPIIGKKLRPLLDNYQ